MKVVYPHVAVGIVAIGKCLYVAAEVGLVEYRVDSGEHKLSA